MTPPDEQARRVTLALRQAQRSSAAARAALARRLSLGITDLAALDHLMEDGDAMGPVELGNRLGIRSASATILVDRLERAGHLTRSPHPQDRRRQTLVPTAHARTEAWRALSPMVEPLNAAAAELTGDEAEVVIRYLRRAAEIMDGFAAEAPR